MKCPKCKKYPYLLEEDYILTKTWDMDEETGKLGEGITGHPIPEKITAFCKCGHKWKFKKSIFQLSQKDIR